MRNVNGKRSGLTRNGGGGSTFRGKLTAFTKQRVELRILELTLTEGNRNLDGFAVLSRFIGYNRQTRCFHFTAGIEHELRILPLEQDIAPTCCRMRPIES